VSRLTLGATQMRRQRNNQRLVPRSGGAPLSVGDEGSQVTPAQRVEPASASPGARYTREWRQRKHNGHCLLNLEVDEAAVVIGLIDHGLLSPLRADDRGALTEAARKALMLFCEGEGSLPDRRVYDKVRIELALRALRRKLPHGSSERRPQRAKPPRAKKR
jgi:hypothetical protein